MNDPDEAAIGRARHKRTGSDWPTHRARRRDKSRRRPELIAEEGEMTPAQAARSLIERGICSAQILGPGGGA